MRMTIALAAAALMAASLLPSVAEAAGGRSSNQTRANGLKTCIATSPATGRRVSWQCQANQKCCFAPLFNAGSCAPASAICL